MAAARRAARAFRGVLERVLDERANLTARQVLRRAAHQDDTTTEAVRGE